MTTFAQFGLYLAAWIIIFYASYRLVVLPVGRLLIDFFERRDAKKREILWRKERKA